MKKKYEKILTQLAIVSFIAAAIVVFIKDPGDRIDVALILGSIYCIVLLIY